MRCCVGLMMPAVRLLAVALAVVYPRAPRPQPLCPSRHTAAGLRQPDAVRIDAATSLVNTASAPTTARVRASSPGCTCLSHTLYPPHDVSRNTNNTRRCGRHLWEAPSSARELGKQRCVGLCASSHAIITPSFNQSNPQQKPPPAHLFSETTTMRAFWNLPLQQPPPRLTHLRFAADE